MTARDYQHVGTGWAFPIRWETADDDRTTAEVATGVDKIRQSMEIIVRTDIGERRMRPRFGSNANAFVFEPADGASMHQLAYFTERALRLFEPRILVDGVAAVPRPDEGRVDIQVEFRIDRHRRPTSLVVPFYPDPATAP